MSASKMWVEPTQEELREAARIVREAREQREKKKKEFYSALAVFLLAIAAYPLLLGVRGYAVVRMLRWVSPTISTGVTVQSAAFAFLLVELVALYFRDPKTPKTFSEAAEKMFDHLAASLTVLMFGALVHWIFG